MTKKPTYLTDHYEIEEVKHDETFESRHGRTADGYTTRAGAPIGTMIRLKGNKRWRSGHVLAIQ